MGQTLLQALRQEMLTSCRGAAFLKVGPFAFSRVQSEIPHLSVDGRPACWRLTHCYSSCCCLTWRKACGACGGMQVSLSTETNSYSFSGWNVPGVTFLLFGSSDVIPEMLERRSTLSEDVVLAVKCRKNPLSVGQKQPTFWTFWTLHSVHNLK